MRTLRSPTSAAEISPQLMADLIANLRKLCNLSGTGCTITELPNGISVDVPPQKFPILVNLTEDWYACDSAQATILSVSLDSDGKRIVSDTGQTAMCDDPAGMITWNLAAVEDGFGSLYIPAGYYCTVWLSPNSPNGAYWLLHGGQPCETLASGSGSGTPIKPKRCIGIDQLCSAPPDEHSPRGYGPWKLRRQKDGCMMMVSCPLGGSSSSSSSSSSSPPFSCVSVAGYSRVIAVFPDGSGYLYAGFTDANWPESGTISYNAGTYNFGYIGGGGNADESELAALVSSGGVMAFIDGGSGNVICYLQVIPASESSGNTYTYDSSLSGEGVPGANLECTCYSPDNPPDGAPVLAFAYPNMNISSNGGALSFSTGQFVMVVDNDGSQQVIGAIQINTVTNEGTYYYIQPETSVGNGCTDLSGATVQVFTNGEDETIFTGTTANTAPGSGEASAST